MITLPCPDAINGTQLAEEITAAGFTDVQVSVAGGELVVSASGLVDPVAPAEQRAECESFEDVERLNAVQAEVAATANADALAKVAEVVKEHRPAPPPPTAEERVAAIIDAAPDWKSAMKQLSAEGLLA